MWKSRITRISRPAIQEQFRVLSLISNRFAVSANSLSFSLPVFAVSQILEMKIK
jgi:hypothetical protein